MDLKTLRDEALKLKEKASTISKDVATYGASKLADSGFTLREVSQLEKFIEKSLPTSGIDSQTGKKKEFPHKVIVIFTDPESDFFKEMLYALPVLSAKAFSQNIALKLADMSMKDINLKAYEVYDRETLVVFENKEVIKTLEGQENIQKVVKSMSLDINSSIDSI